MENTDQTEVTEVAENFDVDCASKDELILYAEVHHHTHLSGREKLEELRIKVKELMNKTCEPEAEAKPDKEQDYDYCLNPENGRVLIASKGMRRLVDRGELVPCTKDGTIL